MSETDRAYANPRLRPVPFGLNVGYGLGAAIDGIATNTVNIFLLFYLTAVCGVGGVVAGAALSAGLVVDAVIDPLLGAWSDSWRSRWGRRLPFMMVGLVPVLLVYVAIFSIPRGLSGVAQGLYVAALSILLRCVVSVFNLPYQAFGAEVTDDYAERSRVAAWRWAWAMIGLLACVVLGYGAFFTGAEGLMRRSAYTGFAVTSAGLMLISGLIAMVCTARLRERAHLARDTPSLRAFVHDVGEVFRNPSFRVLFASALFFFLAQAISVSANLHANTFFWRLTGGEAQLVTLCSLAGLVIGAPILTPFAVRLEKRTALLIGLFGWVAVQAGLPLVRLLGGLKMEHGPLALVLGANALFGGLALSMAAIAFISMMADAADEHEFLFAKRREGLYFAGWAFASKAANGLGALVAGVALQLIGFPQDLASRGGLHATLPPDVVERLGILVGPGAGVASLIGIVVLWGYRLDRKRHADLLATLTDRRAAGG